MELKSKSVAGTMESSDCLITVEPTTDQTITIHINSAVQKQFGKQIEAVVRTTLNEMNITSGLIQVNDKGALDCAIVARLKTAIMRSCEQESFNWEV